MTIPKRYFVVLNSVQDNPTKPICQEIDEKIYWACNALGYNCKRSASRNVVRYKVNAESQIDFHLILKLRDFIKQ